MSTNIHLPVEIWELVFQFLPVNDLIAISSTCKRLRSIVFSLVLEKRVSAHLSSTDPHLLQQFIQSSIRYRKWVFMNIRLSASGSFGTFFDHISSTLRSLSLNNVRLDCVFVQLLFKCPKLEELRLIAGTEMFIPWYINEDGSEEPFPLRNLKRFSINAKSFINDSIFDKITSSMCQLESVALIGCPVSNRASHQNQQNWGLVDAHRLSLHFETIFQLIQRNRRTLKCIDLTKTHISSDKLLKLFSIPELELEQISLSRSSRLDLAFVSYLVRKGSPLKSLDFSLCESLIDENFEALEHELPLEKLDISYTPGIVEAPFIPKLPKLRKLNLCQSVPTPRRKLMRSVLNGSYPYLTYLDCSFNHLEKSDLQRLCSVAPNIRYLYLVGCVNVNDEDILCLCKKYLKLKVLNLKDCQQVTDYGLTGRTDDAGSKQSQPPIPDESETAIIEGKMNGLQLLTELEGLNLNNVPITYQTFSFGFNSKYLRELDLGNCQKLGPIAIGKVLVKCRRIEVLSLKYCYQITDSTILLVSQFLRRIRVLHLDHCTKLTDDSVDSLYNSIYLRILTLQKCSLIHRYQLDNLLRRNPYLKSVVGPSGADILDPLDISDLS